MKPIVAAAATGAAVAIASRRGSQPNTPLAVPPPGDAFTIAAIDGTPLSGEIIGHGPTVVLSHCWTGDRTIWDPVAAELVTMGLQVVLYDHRGHGASGDINHASDTTIATLAQDLATLLSTLDITDAVLAGHSMGGMTVLSYATRFPHEASRRVKYIDLVSTAASSPLLTTTAGAAKWMVASGVGDRVVQSCAGRLLTRGALGSKANRAANERTLATYRATHPSCRRAFLEAVETYDVRARLPLIDVPATVHVGSRDILTPSKYADYLHQHLPSSEFCRYRGAGHMLPLERSAELARSFAAHSAPIDLTIQTTLKESQ